MGWVRNWRVDLGHALSLGVGSVIALTIAGWPSDAALTAWVGLAGGLVGLAVAFGVEHVLRLRAEVQRLKDIEHELSSARTLWDQERKLRDEQLALARREAAISEVETKVWGDAVVEAQKTGQVPPLSVIMARREVEQKARNLHLPLPSHQSQDKRAA
jgi:hypothetical protein